MTLTDGTVIADAGTSKQYYPDIEGGWMYIVTTTINVEQHNLQSVQNELAQAEKQLADAQARVDELKPQAESFATLIDPVKVALNATVEEVPLHQ